MDFSKIVIESFKRKTKRFKAGTAATLIAGAIVAPTAMQAGDIPDVFLTSGLSAGGIYAGHMVLGAADGLKAQDQLGLDTLGKVEELRDVIFVVRDYLDENENEALENVQRMGYDQAMNGGWTEVSLNSYMDTVFSSVDEIYNNVARGDVAGIMLYPSLEEDRDAQWHEMAAATLIFDVSTRYLDVKASADSSDFDRYGSGLVATVGNNVVADYEMLGEGVGPSFSNTAGYTLGTPTIMKNHRFPEDVNDPFELTDEAKALLEEAGATSHDPSELTDEAKALLEEAGATSHDPFELTDEAKAVLAEANVVDRDPFYLTPEAEALLEESTYEAGPGL
jgi:hypothetical protein